MLKNYTFKFKNDLFLNKKKIQKLLTSFNLYLHNYYNDRVNIHNYYLYVNPFFNNFLLIFLKRERRFEREKKLINK